MAVLPAVVGESLPTPDELRDAILRTIVHGYSRRGIDVNVLPGSAHYIRAEALARRFSPALIRHNTALAQISPLDATGEDLVRLAGVFGVYARPVGKSAGYLTIATVPDGATITIPAGYQCTLPSGVKAQTTQAYVGITSVTPVQVQAVIGGAQTNAVAGLVVTWDLDTIGQLKKQATIAAGGLTGGRDADSETDLREALIRRLSFPGLGGNPEQMRVWAREASAAVVRAFVYPAVRGPGSYDVAVVGEVDGSVILSGANVSDVKNYIEARVPGSVSGNVTGVTVEPLDVVIALDVPQPVQSGGAGTGWKDGTQWPPAAFTAGSNDGKITAFVSPLATVRTTTAPTVGAQIAVWDSTAGEFKHYIVSNVGGISGAYTINVIDAETSAPGFSFDPSDEYVSADAFNIDDYGETFKAYVESFGPGEKTTSTDILPRGRRYPPADRESPSSLTNAALGALSTAHSEITDHEYLARFDFGTTNTRTTPSIPSTTAEPPKLLTLLRLAFRPIA